MRNIPVLTVSGKSLAMAFEQALVALYTKGSRFKTQYNKSGDPESLDCTLNLTIEESESEPMIHAAFPGGIAHRTMNFSDDYIRQMYDAAEPGILEKIAEQNKKYDE